MLSEARYAQLEAERTIHGPYAHAYRYHDGRVFCPSCASNAVTPWASVIDQAMAPIPADEVLALVASRHYGLQCDGCDEEI